MVEVAKNAVKTMASTLSLTIKLNITPILVTRHIQNISDFGGGQCMSRIIIFGEKKK